MKSQNKAPQKSIHFYQAVSALLLFGTASVAPAASQSFLQVDSPLSLPPVLSSQCLKNSEGDSSSTVHIKLDQQILVLTEVQYLDAGCGLPQSVLKKTFSFSNLSSESSKIRRISVGEMTASTRFSISGLPGKVVSGFEEVCSGVLCDSIFEPTAQSVLSLDFTQQKVRLNEDSSYSNYVFKPSTNGSSVEVLSSYSRKGREAGILISDLDSHVAVKVCSVLGFDCAGTRGLSHGIWGGLLRIATSSNGQTSILRNKFRTALGQIKGAFYNFPIRPVVVRTGQARTGFRSSIQPVCFSGWQVVRTASQMIPQGRHQTVVDTYQCLLVSADLDR